MQYNLYKKNNLIIAAAGSGKTTMLVDTALPLKNARVLILTYTNANEDEIRKKLQEGNNSIPSHVKVQTWYSFMLQHGVRPYQGTFNDTLFENSISGMVFCEGKSGFRYFDKLGRPHYWGIEDFKHFYFTRHYEIYSDKISAFVISANKSSGDLVIKRLENIYTHIFIDEIQDFAGYDLEFIKLLFKSKIVTLLVGDPRQVTYLTHYGAKYPNYRNGKIKEFVTNECKQLDVNIDEQKLSVSHRNNFEICDFSSRLYPDFEPSQPCECEICNYEKLNHTGIWLVKNEDMSQYRENFPHTVLRAESSMAPEWNFGKSKGLGFDRVLIYPTASIKKYLKDGKLVKIEKGQMKDAFDIAKFYVALTRAKFSVGIAYDYKEDEVFIEGVKKYKA